MESFLHAVEAVTIVLLLTATGYFCACKGWMGHETKVFLSKFLMTLAVPIMCVYGLCNSLTHDMIASSGMLLLCPLLAISVSFVLSYLLARTLRLPRRRFGVFMVTCSISNSVFIGYGMCVELFGEICVPYVMLFYMVSTGFTQIVGMGLIRWSGDAAPFSGAMVRKFLLSPTAIAVVLGFLLVYFSVPIPSLLLSFGRYFNNLVSPLALMLTGYIIHEIGLSSLRMERDLAVMLGFRFLLGPAIFIVVARWLGITGLAFSVYIVESAMPVVTQSVVAAAEYGADERFAAQGAAISTIASFAVIPILMLFLS